MAGARMRGGARGERAKGGADEGTGPCVMRLRIRHVSTLGRAAGGREAPPLATPIRHYTPEREPPRHMDLEACRVPGTPAGWPGLLRGLLSRGSRPGPRATLMTQVRCRSHRDVRARLAMDKKQPSMWAAGLPAGRMERGKNRTCGGPDTWDEMGTARPAPLAKTHCLPGAPLLSRLVRPAHSRGR